MSFCKISHMLFSHDIPSDYDLAIILTICLRILLTLLSLTTRTARTTANQWKSDRYKVLELLAALVAEPFPKAFEIFTNDKTYVLKAKNSMNNEQWVQCLSIAMAHSQAKGR